MLAAAPVLNGSKSEPFRGAILVHSMNRVTGCQMPVWIPVVHVCAGFMGPLVVAETIQIVAQIPGDIRERAQTRCGVAEIAFFVFATGCGLRFMRRNIKDYGDDDVAIASE